MTEEASQRDHSLREVFNGLKYIARSGASWRMMPGGLGTTSIAYTYDALYRLTGATYSGAVAATFEYVYDAVGNMTAYTETVAGQTTGVSRAFDAANRLQMSMDATAWGLQAA